LPDTESQSKIPHEIQIPPKERGYNELFFFDCLSSFLPSMSDPNEVIQIKQLGSKYFIFNAKGELYNN
jgi:hypothetical protein